MYINIEGLTNKNINEYLKLLTDRTTYNDKYKEISTAKKEIFTQGGASMRPEWLQRIFDEEREEGRSHLLNDLFKKGILTKEQKEELSKEYLVTS